MKDTQAALKVVNQMLAAGVIGKYAIGGAVAATFYLEPTATLDIDIFISFKDVPKSSLVSLDPIFNYLKPLGHKVEDATSSSAAGRCNFFLPTTICITKPFCRP